MAKKQNHKQSQEMLPECKVMFDGINSKLDDIWKALDGSNGPGIIRRLERVTITVTIVVALIGALTLAAVPFAVEIVKHLGKG